MTSTHEQGCRDGRGFGPGGRHGWRAAAVILAGALLASASLAGPPKPTLTTQEAFGADVELAPFVVRGQQLTVSVHARSKRDRKYAEAFAEGVVKVVYDGVTEQTGKGLVIIGAKGEPHPMTVFRMFQDMAAADRLHPEVAAMTQQLDAYLADLSTSWGDNEWSQHEPAEDDDAFTFEIEQVIQALPLPLEGVAARLYQIGWAEGFDEARMSARFQALKPDDLRDDPFVKFDWVFYLPPRGVFERVLNQFIAEALKKEDMGFFTRAAVKSALVIAKPFIRRAIEGMRKGVLFMTIVRARTDYDSGQVSAMMDAYVETMMPGAPKKSRGSAHERAVLAVREAREGLPGVDTADLPESLSDMGLALEAMLEDDGTDEPDTED